ncbi:DUF6382 domain-containing protein [Paenibacillus sp. NFR01]|uniref:DUF6382 domain-containing protein n=1 Tax=Paenibacillus sp. NFR01 TaxID=1566279 RepID=UPI0008D83980|nr:DUF6382 domain-containing protein [Paenibacillus sp. NFR01]SET95274.1 FHA domain-containing protein [Paenibacillus sp. NFR01]
MFGLQCDFIQQDGISMLLRSPSGLTAEQMNMVQARMLMGSSIGHHLRLMLREVDLQITLEYAVSRRKMLSHLLKSEKLDMTSFYGLLLQIAGAMDEGKLYMLQPELYALHADYIFIEGPLNGGKAHLTYVPVQLAELPGAGVSLQMLVMTLMTAITELAGNGIQRLLKYCGDADFSPAGLKLLLAELLTSLPLEQQRREAPEDSIDGTRLHAPSEFQEQEIPPEQRKAERKTERSRTAPMDEEVQRPPWLIHYSLGPEAEASGEATDVEAEDTEETGSSPHKTYTLLAGVLAMALLWKFLYFSHPQMLWLTVCIAGSLCIAAACWMIWSNRWRWGVGDTEEVDEGEEAAGQTFGYDFGSTLEPVKREAPPLERRPGLPLSEKSTPAVEHIFGDHGMKSLGAPFPAMSEAATTQLSRGTPEASTGASARRMPHLERVHEDEGGYPEKIEINRPSFIIGRSAEVAQFVENSEGASRVHVEISRGTDGFILKDLDSRNGTIYQGEVMVPYKEYPLTDGVQFSIIKGRYIFRSA